MTNFRDHTGKIFGNLTVLKRLPNNGKNQRLEVQCSVCAKDPELFGEAKFSILYTSLKSGSLPCGCAKNHRWSQEQYRIRIKRECENKDFTLLESPELYRQHSDSKLHMQCNKDGHSWHVLLHSFLQGSGCSECKRDGARMDASVVFSWQNSENFKNQWDFKRLDDLDCRGNRVLWSYKCSVCSKDEYVIAGLCNGIFKTTLSSLRKGHKSCRCAGSVHLTPAQSEYKIRKHAGNKLEFISWASPFRGIKTPFKAHCPFHFEITTSYKTTAGTPVYCPLCESPKGTFDFNNESSYLYVLKIEGDRGNFTGYGISGSLSNRLCYHKSNLAKNGYRIERLWTFCGNGKLVAETERKILISFPRLEIDLDGFKKENTYSEMLPDVLNLAGSILEVVHQNNA